jgi:tRNA uridine 5-carboxymethylaminomethyl modification enzyme
MAGFDYDIVVIGGGHAGVEAAWAAANLLREEYLDSDGRRGRVALVTMDPARIAQMSCNPAIGGLAKGQMVREIDALGGVMGLAIDATGIQFRVLNASKGPAVRGPRAQADKHRYARHVQSLLATRINLQVIAGVVEDFVVEGMELRSVIMAPPIINDDTTRQMQQCDDLSVSMIRERVELRTRAAVLTTGTFMKGLLHTGPQQVEGGRMGEGAVAGLSGSLRRLGLELGRLKTGTPPRLDADTIDYGALAEQPGDDPPQPFSELTGAVDRFDAPQGDWPEWIASADRFPVMPQRSCWITHTSEAIHERIRANLDRAPLFNGQIVDSVGPRYCPSIEDKVVRFADKLSHQVFLEPEGLDTSEIYCNGIPTSLPADVQDFMVAGLPGCARARIVRYGYAVQYDMVWPHQIDATCMTKSIGGLFIAGQTNGTSGYEEAAGQGLLAGLNAVRHHRGESLVRLGRDQAYIGVLMDDLVTKTPREPYRMFTSRAEHRLMLRADNAPERLTPLGRQLGLVDDVRWHAYQQRRSQWETLEQYLREHSIGGVKLWSWIRRGDVDAEAVLARLNGDPVPRDARLIAALLSEVKYAGFIERHRRQFEQVSKLDTTTLPTDVDYTTLQGLRNEARAVLAQFRPATLGQAGRLAGITPADLTVLALRVLRR